MSQTRSIQLFFLIYACAAIGLSIPLHLTLANAQDSLPADFVYLRNVDSTIFQDIRYANSDNFIGHPLPGYGAPECVLRREVAQALKQVQAELAKQNFALKVYDCYRPLRAVRSMAQWANDGLNSTLTKRFFPRLEKHSLFVLGYIASTSRHPNGIAVDLTIVDASNISVLKFDPAVKYGPCNGPAAERAPDNSVDMGTGFDCFDVKSRTRNTAITTDQQLRRTLLVAVMKKYGFSNYFREWWHFEYVKAEASPQYDFPILPRPS